MSGDSGLVRGGMMAGRVVALGAFAMFLGGCSGDETSTEDGADGNAGASGAGVASTVDAAGAAAATTTAETNANCIAVAPFYWEMGDAGGPLVSGSVGSEAPVGSTVMEIASASKWLFGAYAIQKMGGMPSATDIPFLNFTSGYVGVDSCAPSGTVDDCLAAGTQTAANAGKFDYNSAHLQKLANLMALGSDDNAALATDVKAQIGTDINLEYSEPQPAVGVKASAEQYAHFLRKLLVGSPTPLLIGSLLGNEAVCTNPMTCPTAINSPITGSPSSPESWHYSLTHWVEDDPAAGDGAFSSGGAYGFYPWVDATRTSYGVLAREVPITGHNGYDSAVCGRAIRKAWVTSTAQ